jgi:hypothetical protein
MLPSFQILNFCVKVLQSAALTDLHDRPCVPYQENLRAYAKQAMALVDVSGDDWLAEQVTGAQSYCPDRSVGVEKPSRHADVI